MHFQSAFIALVCAFTVTASLAAQDKTNNAVKSTSPQIMNAKTGVAVNIEQLVTDVIGSDVIFLGEQHDNDAGHQFQFDVIQALVNQGADVTISMEQFERDVQGVVDDYLAGRISEKQFLKNSRPWKNYAKHYRPMIEFAKQNRLPVLAGNVPRRLATDISKGQATRSRDQGFLPRSTTAPEDEYWRMFLDIMKSHMGAESAEKLKSFYRAQCIKDDAMAETITDYLARNQHQRKTVVHLCGHFHSDYGLGTAIRVVQRDPLLRISVVTMETIPENGKLETEGVRARGHYIFWTVKNARKPKTSGANGKNKKQGATMPPFKRRIILPTIQAPVG